MRPLLALVVAAAVLATAAAPAAARPYDVPAELGGVLRAIATRSDVPVRVPARLNLDFDDAVYASGSTARRSWQLSLGAIPECGGANACFLATFSGKRGGTPAFRRRVSLARGITGYFKPMSCGASCSPPMLQWRQRRVLYSIQAKLGVSGAAAQRREMVRAASSAIRGPAR